MSTGVNIPITADATPLVRECNKATAALNSMGTTADKAGEKVEAGFKVSGGSVQKAVGAFGQIGGVLGKLSPALGSAASSMTGLTSGFSGLAAAGAEAGISTGAMVAAAAAATAGVAALASVVVGAGAAIYTMGETLVTAGFKANDALDALHGFDLIGSDFFPKVSKESQDSFDTLATSGAAINALMAKLTVIIASSTGPAMAQLTNIVIGLATHSLHLFEIWAAGKNLLNEFAVFITEVFLTSLAPVTATLLNMGQAFVTLADLVGQEVDPAVRAALSGTEGLARGLINLAGVGLKGATLAFSDYAAEGASFIADTKKAEDAVEDETKGVKSHTKAIKEDAEALSNWSTIMRKAQDDIAKGTEDLVSSAAADRIAVMGVMEAENARYAAKIEALKAVAKAVEEAGGSELKAELELEAALIAAGKLHAKEVADIEKDAADKAADLSKKARDQKISDQQAVGQAVIGLGNDLIAATTKQYDTTTKVGREAAEKQFKAQKAAQMAMAVVAGALAIQQALSGSPPPANFIMAGITGAAAAIELGVIAAAQPKFHMGTTGMRPDEYTATLQRGEGVVTSAGMSKPGMKETVAAANSGRTPGGTGGSMNMVYQHKVYNEFIRDNLKAGSPLTRRIDNGTKVGHRQSRS